LYEEKLKTIFHQNWIVFTRKAQFNRKINNALLNNIYQVSPIFQINVPSAHEEPDCVLPQERCNFGRVTSIADIGTLSRDAIWYDYGLYPFTCRCGVEVVFQFQAKAVAVFIDGYSKI